MTFNSKGSGQNKKLEKYKKPVLICENGTCTNDDDLRKQSLYNHLKYVKKALDISSGNIEVMDSFILAAKVEDFIREVLQIDTIPLLPPIDALGVRNDIEKRNGLCPMD